MKNLKFLLLALCLFLGFGPRAFSKEKIVVAKAVGVPALYKKTLPILRKALINKVHKKIFKKGLRRLASSDFEIVVLDYADAHQLFLALRDPEVVGLIFAGHLRLDRHGKGVALVDDFGFDLTPVLFNRGESLRFISLMGCSSLDLINSLKSEFGDDFSGVEFLGFEKKIPLNSRYFDSVAKKTLEGLAETKSAVATEGPRDSVLLELTRTCPSAHLDNFQGTAPALLISFEGEKEAIGSFPACARKAEVQTTQVKLSPSRLRDALDSGLALVASSGKNTFVSETAFVNEYIGEIQVKGPGLVSEMQRDLFDESRPLGITEHLINLRPSIQD